MMAMSMITIKLKDTQMSYFLVCARLKSNRDLFLFNSITTHSQSTNKALMSIEVLDLDFVKQRVHPPISKPRATILMICLDIVVD